MKSNKSFVGLLLIVSLAGCSADSNPPAAPLEPDVPAPQPPPVSRVARVQFNIDSVVVIRGFNRELSAFVFDAGLRAMPNELVVWSSSDTTVATVASDGNCGLMAIPGCYRTSVHGRGDGLAIITATVGGVSAGLYVRSYHTIADANGIDVDFSVIEFFGPSYGPLISVSETTGKRIIEILGFGIRIPPSISDTVCAGSIIVGPGSTKSLFQNIYDDYWFVMSNLPARTSDEAVATVYLRDESGTVSKKEVIGKITPTPYQSTSPPGFFQDPAWHCS